MALRFVQSVRPWEGQKLFSSLPSKASGREEWLVRSPPPTVRFYVTEGAKRNGRRVPSLAPQEKGVGERHSGPVRHRNVPLLRPMR